MHGRIDDVHDAMKCFDRSCILRSLLLPLQVCCSMAIWRVSTIEPFESNQFDELA